MLSSGYTPAECVVGSNPLCANRTRCKAVAKDSATYDSGAVERMISQGELPLSIVHMGAGGTQSLLEQTNDTVLFYWFEPDALIRPNSSFIRLNFDAPVACASSSYNLVPEKITCDFGPGLPHKGYSERMNTAADARQVSAPLEAARRLSDGRMRTHTAAQS